MPDRSLDVADMRHLDAVLGRPLCRLLTVLARLRRRSATDDGPVRRMLLVKLAEQGATVAALPALRRCCEMVGSENVYVAVFAENRFVLDELDVIPRANVLTVRTTSRSRVLRDLVRVARRCRRLGVDTAVDLELFSRTSALLAVLSGAHRRAGLHAFSGEGPDRGDLMTHRVSATPTQHISHTFLALVEAVTQPPERLPAIDAGPWPLEAPPPIEPRPDELAEVAAIVADAFGRDDAPPLVLLNPNSGDLVPLRRWPTERYVALARTLLDRHPEIVVGVTGAPSERAAAEEVVDAIGSDRCANLAGRTTMRQLLVLYFLAEVMVTNDSGPAHYATLTPMDVIVLFGPETPAVFGPVSPRSHHLWAGLPCSPCVNAFNNRLSPCRDNLCMQRIGTGEVADAVTAAYRDRRAATRADERHA